MGSRAALLTTTSSERVLSVSFSTEERYRPGTAYVARMTISHRQEGSSIEWGATSVVGDEHPEGIGLLGQDCSMPFLVHLGAVAAYEAGARSGYPSHGS